MWRRRWWVLAMLGSLTACGGGDGGGGSWTLVQRLADTWEMIYQSTDGGETYDEVTNGFAFVFNEDGTWSDTTGDAGTWSVSGSQLVIRHYNDPDVEYLYFQLENNDENLRITVMNETGTAVARISIYQRGDGNIIRTRQTTGEPSGW